ncbi:MAG TPA: pitrilysin family protein, partial [Kofleriaceae bacterium]|nr:pitrilysin family protein [Kofleriaceae bacterium]
MIPIDGPRGAKIYIAPDHALPLLWTTVAIRGGAAQDPTGQEGLARHTVELARRGAGNMSRHDLDAALDDLGASFDPGVSRDSVSFSGLTLSRHIDRALPLWATILAEPSFSADEHGRLIRETVSSLDDLRDDDALVAQRAFDRAWAPGHAYARSARGTEASLAALTVDAARATHRRQVVPANLVIGFAGDVDEARARELATRLIAKLADGPAPQLPDVAATPRVRGRRIILVDKPDRQKTQIYIGHPAPVYGTDDAAHLSVVETAFGGMFSSRLMQAIRVERGWSSGASFR